MTIPNQMPSAQNLMSTSIPSHVTNILNFQVIDSTLCEGEHFVGSQFDLETKRIIAKAIDGFGVQYIKLTNPYASDESWRNCEAICRLNLNAKIITHIECHLSEAEVAVQTGVHGINVVIGSSSCLHNFSHSEDLNQIKQAAIEVIEFIKSKGLEVYFSTADSFLFETEDIISLYAAIDKLGVARIGITDTVGNASPRQVEALVQQIREHVGCEIEVHFHNDTGCAIANAYSALEAGATHIDTSVLGIGQRNGITPLGGLMARLIVGNRESVVGRFKIGKLKELEDLVAKTVHIEIPFNNYVTGSCAFSHKAGIHAKAVLNNAATYEVINPSDFGVSRSILIASRLTGWNAIRDRARQLGSDMTESESKEATAQIKKLADMRPISEAEVDQIIREKLESR